MSCLIEASRPGAGNFYKLKMDANSIGRCHGVSQPWATSAWQFSDRDLTHGVVCLAAISWPSDDATQLEIAPNLLSTLCFKFPKRYFESRNDLHWSNPAAGWLDCDIMMSYTGGSDLDDLLDMPLKRRALPSLCSKTVKSVTAISWSTVHIWPRQAFSAAAYSNELPQSLRR